MQAHQISSEDVSDDSSCDSRDEQNSKAYDAWLKDVKNRPKRGQNANLATASQRKFHGLIKMETYNANQSTKIADTSSYIHALKNWQKEHQKSKDFPEITLDAEEAKRLIEEKRQQILAMAISFNEWMTLSEEKKQLMTVIQREHIKKLEETERAKFVMRTSRGISFQKWKEKLDGLESHLQSKQQPSGQGSGVIRPLKAVSFHENVK